MRLDQFGNDVVRIPAEEGLAWPREVRNRGSQLHISGGAHSRLATVKPETNAHQLARRDKFHRLAQTAKSHHIQDKCVWHTQLRSQTQIWQVARKGDGAVLAK